MSEAKFTPGPWRHVGFGALYLIKGDEAPDIAVVQPRTAVAGRALANARLIAAAPDLYEALKAFAAEPLSNEPGHSRTRLFSFEDLDEKIRRARAALAKVDGER